MQIIINVLNIMLLQGAARLWKSWQHKPLCQNDNHYNESYSFYIPIFNKFNHESC